MRKHEEKREREWTTDANVPQPRQNTHIARQKNLWTGPKHKHKRRHPRTEKEMKTRTKYQKEPK